MGKNKKYYLNVIFMAVLLAAVFYVLLKDQDLNDILNAMRGAKKFDMVLSTFAALVYVIMEGVSMQIILHSLDFKKQGLKCVKYSFIGFFFNAITPSASGGQPMQVYYMHEEGINAGASSVTLLFWTIIYKVVLVVFELYVFLFHFDFAVKYIGGYMWLFIIGMAVNVVSIVLYTIIVFSETGAKKLAYMGTWLLHKLKIVRHKEKAEKKLDALLDSYKEGAVYMRTHVKVAIIVFLTTCVQRISYFAVTWFVYRALGGSGFTALEIIMLQSFVSVCIDILPFPGGVGANEGFFVALFAPVMGHSIAVSAMLLSRGSSFYVLVIVSAAVSMFAQFQNVRRSKCQNTR